MNTLAILPGSMHILFAHSGTQRHPTPRHTHRHFNTHVCTSVKAQPPSPFLVNLQGYLHMKPLYHLLWRMNKTLKELFQIHFQCVHECKLKSLSLKVAFAK